MKYWNKCYNQAGYHISITGGYHKIIISGLRRAKLFKNPNYH